MRVPVLGLFSLSLRWAKTCLTRWQHCLHSLFCWFLAQLCLKLCPHRSPHLPVRWCDVGHLFLHKCTEQYNLNVDLRVQVTQNCPQRYVHRVCCCGWPSPRWGMLDQSEELVPSPEGHRAWKRPVHKALWISALACSSCCVTLGESLDISGPWCIICNSQGQPSHLASTGVSRDCLL